VVGIANIGTQVLYAGHPPGLVSGVVKINVGIPSDSAIGVVPLTVLVNGVLSPADVTVAIK
jgi:uncharacterized protein (TIGR03437 family)